MFILYLPTFIYHYHHEAVKRRMSNPNSNTTPSEAEAKRVADAETKRQLISSCDALLASEKCAGYTLFELENQAPSDKPKAGSKNPIISSKRFQFMVLYVTAPSAMSFYALGVLFLSCINRTAVTGSGVSLFWSVFGTWLAGLVLLLWKGCFYLPCSTYCSTTHRDNHKVLHWMTHLCYASILFGYEVYAYTVNGWAALGVFIFWLLYAWLFVVVFLERHVRPCPAYGQDNVHLDTACNKAILVLAGMVHIAFLFCCVVFNYQLTEPWRAARYACTTTETCECLAPG